MDIDSLNFTLFMALGLRVGLLFCLIACLLGPFVGNWLPVGYDSDTDFSEVRALDDLAELSLKIGSRAGSQRFVIEETRRFIVHSIEELVPLGGKMGWNITIEKVTVEGAYRWKTQNYFYKNLHHLLVHVEPDGYDHSTCQGSLLVNTHIDSAVASPGAGDDGIAVVIAIESIRSLTKAPPPPQASPIMFLFNNGEELGLLGTHGFVKQFPHLVRSCGAFINLEAAGTYGPESLFQVSPTAPWLIEQYAASAPYPRGSIVVRFLFLFRS